MHPLKQYLNDVSEPVQAFAARVGASRQTLYRIFGGEHAPKPPLARRIVEATGGAVSFEVLYARHAECAEIILLNARRDNGDDLDPGRLTVAIAIVCNHLSPAAEDGPPDGAFSVAAEAVMNTHAALSTVTTRQGPDRLQQALRPVIEEILTEYLASPPAPSALDQGARLASELYFHTIQLGRNQPEQP